jgi:hypothetical protein
LLDRFLAQTGLQPGGTAQVRVDGEPRLPANTQRVFFIERHDGKKPNHFLAHTEINRHQLSLGSWMGARPVLRARQAGDCRCKKREPRAFGIRVGFRK